MEYILALDQGTTGSRAILYDRDGAIHGLAQREFQQIYPHPGWVEHDPEEIWASEISVAVEALSRANCRTQDVVAVGMARDARYSAALRDCKPVAGSYTFSVKFVAW